MLADEDYRGVNPIYPAGTNAPRYAAQYVDALRANRVRSVVWDIDKDGVPHDLGVLGHFDAVVWYLGDNRLTQDLVDEPVQSVIGPLPDSQVADRAKDTVLNVRSYLNEGGKLIHTGETTSYFGPLREANGGGIYYGLKGHPERPCFISTSFRDDCELLSDDFMQYYLGAFDRADVESPTEFVGEGPLDGTDADLAGTPTNPVDEAGGFEVTSTVLPPTSSRSSGASRAATTSAPTRRSSPSRAVVRRRHPPGRALPPADPHGRPDLDHRRAGPHPPGAAELQHRGGLRPRDRGGAHTRAPRTGPRSRTRTAAPRGRPGRVRGRLLRGDAPVPVALPDRREPVHGLRHQRGVELVHRRVRRLAAGRASTWRPTPASGSRSRSPT